MPTVDTMKLSNFITKSLIFLSALTLIGCSSILNGRTQKVKVITEPKNVIVTINDTIVVENDSFVSIDRATSLFKVKGELDGFRAKEIVEKKEVTSSFIYGILIWPSAVFDFFNGSVFNYPKDEILVTLERDDNNNTVGNRMIGDSGEVEKKNLYNFKEIGFEKIKSIEIHYRESASLFSEGSILITDSIMFDNYNESIFIKNNEDGEVVSVAYNNVYRIRDVEWECTWKPIGTVGLGVAGLLGGVAADNNCTSSGLYSLCGGMSYIFGTLGFLVGLAIDVESYKGCTRESLELDSLKEHYFMNLK